ncbi:hypothetical protein [Sinimarinibacterium flocculans]|uniref:hypothetical protein n=1 Tax=Sinimarinibacterium flocculans TaxID=985250 RepID=UPI0035132F55
MDEAQLAERPQKVWRRLGAMIQGIALGGLLTWAQMSAYAAASKAVLFRYQGF